MKIFITGTAGFIGFHLAKRLLENGNCVHGFDGMTSYYDVTLKRARLDILQSHPEYVHTEAMLEDFDALANAANSCQPDIIIHLAAQAGVRYSIENPRAYVDSNLIGSFNILEIARLLKPRHLLLASTSSVYGSNEKVPFEERDKTDEPMTLYAATKKSMEVMAHSYSHLWNIPTTAFRFFTVYGPYGRPDMALFRFAKAGLDGKPIEVYGEGRQERDFTYIDDLVECIVRLMEVIPEKNNRFDADGATDSLSSQAPYRIVNLGGGAPVGLLRFIDTVEQTLGISLTRNMLPMQKGDVPRTYASPKLLEALTGFRPTTEIEQGVASFCSWFKENYAN